MAPAARQDSDCPFAVAVDSAGNVYVADTGNDEIRKITPSGVVTTLAGSAGQAGSSDGTGSAARFDGPRCGGGQRGQRLRGRSSNDEIRKITPSGVVTTLAGSAGQIGSSDGTGSAARFDYPVGVAVDSAGNVYVADQRMTRSAWSARPSWSRVTRRPSARPSIPRNAGTGKTLTAAGSVNDGNGGSNYAVTFVTNTTGQITPRAITVTAATGTKGYDGTTSSAATPTITSGSLATGDTAAFTETFDTKNAGTGKTLTAAGSVNDGNSGSNYTVTFATTPRARSRPGDHRHRGHQHQGLRRHDHARPRRRSPPAAWPPATRRPSARPSTPGTRARARRSPPAGSVNDGNGGSNYAVTFAANTTGAITARAITVTAATAPRATTARPRRRPCRRSPPAAWPPATRRPSARPTTRPTPARARRSRPPARSPTATAATIRRDASWSTRAGGDSEFGRHLSRRRARRRRRGVRHAGNLTATVGAADLPRPPAASTFDATTSRRWDRAPLESRRPDLHLDPRRLPGLINVTAGDTITVTCRLGLRRLKRHDDAAVRPRRSRSPRPAAPRSTTVQTRGRQRPRSPPAVSSSGDTAAFSETFNTRNAGTGKTLTAAGSVNDGDGGKTMR